MKRTKALSLLILLFTSFIAFAQVNVNVNIGSAPGWAPRDHGNCRYYYLPDIDCYYDVHQSVFIYQDGRRWVHRKELPPRYRGYNFHRGRTVVLRDYRGNAPYERYNDHRRSYGGRGTTVNNTVVVNNRRGPAPAPQPRYDNKHHDNGKHNGNGHGNGHRR